MPVSPMSFSLSGKWVEYGHKLDPARFRAALDKTLPAALDKAGFVMVKLMRRKMSDGKYERNANLTIAIKHSSKPLIDFGDMYAAVTHVVGYREAFVGILQTAKARDGSSISNIAEALHEGVRIPVTPRMRRMFFYLALASEGTIDPNTLTGRAEVLFRRNQDWRPLKETTTHIIIPARPFAKRAFEDEAFRAKFKVELEKAVIQAIKLIK